MNVALRDRETMATEHAMLVPYGRFAQQVGLIEAVERVLFGMKTYVHSPADKVIELFAHISAGGMHVNELARSAHPLVQDRAVAQAWAQESFASASGVSALLHSVTPESVAALKVELAKVLEPYRRRILREVSPAWLVVDLDLTGLVVSDQAATYEGADYGYMGEIARLGRGYQFARAQLVAPRDTLVLGGFLHPGHTISAHCLRELVGLVEEQLGRPRRRVEAVEVRLKSTEGQLATVDSALAKLVGRAKASAGYQARLVKRRERLVEELKLRRAQIAQMIADNASNPNPRRIILRLDGGFGDSEGLAWLYEQGYCFVARAHNQKVAESLRQEAGLNWQKVSKNGFIAESQRTTLGRCPHPLRLFGCRQQRGAGKAEHWSALVVTPELDPTDWSARRVGTFYNQRQSMEAGIKEAKGIFASRHLPTRHQPGIALYQELVLLAQNLLRWFRRQALGNTVFAAAGIKELVRIGANSRAEVISRPGSTLLRFAPSGLWAGLTLSLNSQVAWQLPLPSFDDFLLAGAGP